MLVSGGELDLSIFSCVYSWMFLKRNSTIASTTIKKDVQLTAIIQSEDTEELSDVDEDQITKDHKAALLQSSD